MSFTTLKKGSYSNVVKALQYIIGVKADKKYGSDTENAIKIFQNKYGLIADGVVGKKTIEAIISHAPVLKLGSTGPYVYALETLLTTMKLDGIYAQDELAHVKTYQASKGLDIDGVVGKKTWSTLFGVDQEEKNEDNKSNSSSSVNTKVGQPTNFKQYDKRWASVVYTQNNTYNKKQTIKSSGCGPTSMADIINYWFDKSITPKEMAALAVKNGYRSKNSGTSWDFYKFISKKYPFSKFIQTSSFATMQNCLAAGGLVVVSFKKSKWTNGG